MNTTTKKHETTAAHDDATKDGVPPGAAESESRLRTRDTIAAKRASHLTGLYDLMSMQIDLQEDITWALAGLQGCFEPMDPDNVRDLLVRASTTAAIVVRGLKDLESVRDSEERQAREAKQADTRSATTATASTTKARATQLRHVYERGLERVLGKAPGQQEHDPKRMTVADMLCWSFGGALYDSDLTSALSTFVEQFQGILNGSMSDDRPWPGDTLEALQGMVERVKVIREIHLRVLCVPLDEAVEMNEAAAEVRS